MKPEDELQATIADMTKPGKGILAADESLPTITKRFKAVGIDCTDETRRAYRSLLITTPGAEQFLSGVILFEETLGQNAEDGTPLPQVLARRGAVTQGTLATFLAADSTTLSRTLKPLEESRWIRGFRGGDRRERYLELAPAEGMELVTAAGTEVSLEDYRGLRSVVLWFSKGLF